MVHLAAYPLTWLSCLKHRHDPQCFIWSLLAQHHQFCLLGKKAQKMYATSYRHNILYTPWARPGSHSSRWEPWEPHLCKHKSAASKPCLLGTDTLAALVPQHDLRLPTGLVPLPPQPAVFAAPQVLPCPCAPRFPSQGKQGTRWHSANWHIHTGRGVPRSHSWVMHCNVSCNVQTVLAFGTNISSLREGVRTA